MSDERTVVPKEVEAEIIERQESAVTTLSVLAVQDVERAFELAHLYQDGSIKLTLSGDWVVHGGQFGFLMDAGCQRVAPLWQIDWRGTDLKRDMQEFDLEDGEYAVEVVVRAHCRLTGTEHEDFGTRDSTGFFEKQWKASEGSAVARRRVKAEIRKAAIANGRGRIVRAISGLGRVPVEKLAQCGFDPRKLGAVTYQEGSKGGSGSTYASDAQVNLICGESLNRGKVAGLKDAIGFEDLKKLIHGQNIAKGKASDIIKRLKAAETGAVAIEEFEAAIGRKLDYQPSDDEPPHPADGDLPL